MCLGFFWGLYEVEIKKLISQQNLRLQAASMLRSFCIFFRQNDWGKALDWGVRVFEWGIDMISQAKVPGSNPRPFIFLFFRFPVFCTYEVEVLGLENLDCQLLRPLSSLSIWPLRNWNFVERVVIAVIAAVVAVVVDFFVVVELVT